jgi:hypothetical protein
VFWCLDEFGPMSLMPHPGRHWAAISGRNADPDRDPRAPDGERPTTATTPPAPARRLQPDRRQAVRARQARQEARGFLEFCRYLRTLHPLTTRIAIICDNFSPHLATKKDARVGGWAAGNNVEIA